MPRPIITYLCLDSCNICQLEAVLSALLPACYFWDKHSCLVSCNARHFADAFSNFCILCWKSSETLFPTWEDVVKTHQVILYFTFYVPLQTSRLFFVIYFEHSHFRPVVTLDQATAAYNKTFPNRIDDDVILKYYFWCIKNSVWRALDYVAFVVHVLV